MMRSGWLEPRIERTLGFIKPDAMQRGLAGEIISRFERRGLKIIGMKLIQVSQELAEQHYAEHIGKEFYEWLVSFITASPVIVFVLEGSSAIEAARALVGKTNPLQAAAGSIRADLGLETRRNLIHVSDSEAAAEIEIALFFSDGEVRSYTRPIDSSVSEFS